MCSATGACEPVDYGDDRTGDTSCWLVETCSGGRCLEILQRHNGPVDVQPPVSPRDKLAQTIKFGNAGQLEELRVGWSCGMSAVSVEKLTAAGAPSGEQLAAVQLHDADDPGLFTAIAVSPPLSVSAGDRIALVLTALASAGANSNCNAYATSNDSYLDGSAFTWHNNDQTWTALPRVDLNFKVIVSR